MLATVSSVKSMPRHRKREGEKGRKTEGMRRRKIVKERKGRKLRQNERLSVCVHILGYL